jgi:hypothetical protein
MAWMSSMLFTLNAPSAYLPFNAFANKSRVCVSGIIFVLLLFDQPIPISQTLEMIARFLTKETKITACDQTRIAKYCE